MTTTELRITPFSPAHQSAARQLILDGLGEHWGCIDEQLNGDLESIAQSYASGHFVLGWSGDTLVATGAMIPDDGGSKRIVRMSVARAFRRKGFGTQILDHLVKLSRQAGVKKLVLETTETWHDVVTFYESYGFRVVARREGDAHLELDIERAGNTQQSGRGDAATRVPHP